MRESERERVKERERKRERERERARAPSPTLHFPANHRCHKIDGSTINIADDEIKHQQSVLTL